VIRTEQIDITKLREALSGADPAVIAAPIRKICLGFNLSTSLRALAKQSICLPTGTQDGWIKPVLITIILSHRA
jgi:hypothetical protein